MDSQHTAAAAPRLSRRAVLGGTAVAGGLLAAPTLTALTTASAESVLPAATPAPVTPAAAPPAPRYPAGWTVRPFELGDVTLDGGSVFQRASEELLILARNYPIDSLLVIFRLQAGLLTKAQAEAVAPAGGWEGWPDRGVDAAIVQRWGPEYVRGTNKSGASGLLRGHYAGHMLSSFAQAYASTGDAAILARIATFVDGLEECRAAMAAQRGGVAYSHPGFLSAYGEWQFTALEEFAPYGEIWAPYYTLAKILAGLNDVYRFTGLTTALTLAQGIGHWTHGRLTACTEEQLQRMWAIYIGGEYGGMNEALYDLYELSAGSVDPFGGSRQEFLAAAKLFDNNTLISSLNAQQDALTDLHANQHIPQFVGYAKLGAAGQETAFDSGDYLTAAAEFWEMIVPGRMYSHGGTGEGELWGPPHTVAGDIGARNAESCAAYNMLKVSRSLFFADQDPKYMDYYERTLLNHILGGRSRALPNAGKTDRTLTPGNCYMYPVNPGATKEYGNGNIGTCCGGSALESHTKYQDSVWFHSASDDALYVNLFIPSTLTWKAKGVTLQQETTYPVTDTTTVTVTAGSASFSLRVRIPAWADGAAVAVAGGTAAAATPGTYFTIPARTWSVGDRVEVTLPMRLRTEATDDRPDIQSLFHGPTLLNAVSSQTKYLQLGFYGALGLDGTIAHGVEPVSDPRGEGNHFRMGSLEFEPAYNGNTAAYSMYFQRNEATVAFAGLDSRVTNPGKAVAQGGTQTTVTLLDEIWEAAPFADRSSFLRRVQQVTRDWEVDGRLTSRDRQLILLTAGRAGM